MGKLFAFLICACLLMAGYTLDLLAILGDIPLVQADHLLRLSLIGFLAAVTTLVLFGLIVAFLHAQGSKRITQPQEAREEEDYETAWQGWEEDAAWASHEGEPTRSWECSMTMEQWQR